MAASYHTVHLFNGMRLNPQHRCMNAEREEVQVPMPWQPVQQRRKGGPWTCTPGTFLCVTMAAELQYNQCCTADREYDTSQLYSVSSCWSSNLICLHHICDICQLWLLIQLCFSCSLLRWRIATSMMTQSPSHLGLRLTSVLARSHGGSRSLFSLCCVYSVCCPSRTFNTESDLLQSSNTCVPSASILLPLANFV